jgi:hypothetical protein
MDNNTINIEKMITQINNKKVSEATNIFNQILKNKLKIRLEEERIKIASTMLMK